MLKRDSFAPIIEVLKLLLSGGAMKENSNYQAYGLFTVITMIVGIVVGSGIFFKSDDILIATGGNFKLGLVILVMGAMGIIFGSLSLSQFALDSQDSGGAMSYFEQCWSQSLASGFGLFQLVMYLPSVPAVVAWAGALYTFMLLGIPSNLEMEVALGVVYLTLFCLLNALRRIWGGYIQNLSTIIKLIPLFLIPLAGIFFSKGSLPLPADVTPVTPSNQGINFLAALAPMAFSYDGWIISTTIAPEVKNPKRNVPLALVLSPLLILLIYILYFTGVVHYAGETFILSMGDATINTISMDLLGPIGGKILMVFVVVSVLGVLNGVCLAGIRMPQALAQRGMFPKTVEELHPRYNINLKSSLIFYLLTLFWMVLHYFILKYNLLGGRDASEIAIVFSYTTYILLYIRLIQGYLKGQYKNFFRNFLSPILATLAAFLMVAGALLSSPFYVLGFLLFNTLVFLLGTRLYKEEKDERIKN